MEKLFVLAEKLDQAFGTENMIEYVCSLTNEQVLSLIDYED